MRLLIDTHILIWLVLNDARLSRAQREVLAESDNSIFLSAVTAYELTHLQQRHRIPLTESVAQLQELVGFETADLPVDIWHHIAQLPDIHRDPIDRMLIAHALSADMTPLSADANIRRYPVACV